MSPITNYLDSQPNPPQGVSARLETVSRTLQRKCVCGQHSDGGECSACAQKRKRIQRKSSAEDNSEIVPPIVTDVLRSPGQPLGSSTRTFMESRFGQDLTQVRLRTASIPMRDGLGDSENSFEREADQVADGVTRTTSRSSLSSQSSPDFSGVQVHTGSQAAASARAINATAYTVGNHLVFDEGRFSPETQSGQWLLAHELSHVVQQQAAPLTRPTIQRQAGGTPPAADGGLTQEMLEQIARRLREAMAGLGTDEDAIFSAFSGRTQQQADAIARVYAELFGRPLMDDLRDELSDADLLKLGLFSAGSAAGAAGTATEQAAGLADVVARQLNEAMEGAGTNEDSIFSALSGRTQAELEAIKQAYTRLTNRELEADLRDELSGTELTEAIQLLNQGLLHAEDELYLAMAGLGTDEDTIFRVLGALTGNNAAITSMEAEYRRKYGDLIADLRSDLSGSEYKQAMRILGPAIQDIAFEDCAATVIPAVRAIIPTGIANVDKAIQVLSLGWTGMSATQQGVFNRFFDPSNSGVDDRFVSDVLTNFRLIRAEFDGNIVAECETSSSICTSLPGRLYYTYWGNIHVCPYFMTESDTTRQARDFVHELAHNALLAVDRPYYRPGSADYAALTPRGSVAAQIPVIGPLVRAISRSDTLYHPDAYSWFAFTI